MYAVHDLEKILAYYMENLPSVQAEHESAGKMVEELGKELEVLCLKFAAETGWTEATGHQPRARAMPGRRKRKTALQMFDSSEEEEEGGLEAGRDLGPSGSGEPSGTQGLGDSTVRVIRAHVQEYLRERLRAREAGTRRCKDPLAYWSQNQGRWPVVAQIARHSLCVPAASATSERAFSGMGHIVRARRGSLSDERIGQLSFLSANPDV